MINKARTQPTYKTLSRILAVVRQVFGDKENEKRNIQQEKESEEEEEQKKREPVLSKALDSKEYLILL